jgi:hypothetical protein
MASWRDYARAVEPNPETCANSAVSANSPGLSPAPAPIGTIGAIGTASLSLPLPVARGLAALPTMACPVDLNASGWPRAVADAVKFGADGWAAKAIALGWTDLDLFGVVAARNGDPDADGLAVKLAGRPVLAICGTFATVDLGNGGRLYLRRGDNDGARLLWALGYGRSERAGCVTMSDAIPSGDKRQERGCSTHR